MTHHRCTKRARRPAARFCAVGALLLVGGCAIDYTDDAGVRHVTGFASITIPPPETTAPTAGHVVDVTTVGLSITEMPEGGSVTIGYNRAVTAVLNDNALVLGNPLTIGEYDDAAPSIPLTEVPAQDTNCLVCPGPDADLDRLRGN